MNRSSQSFAWWAWGLGGAVGLSLLSRLFGPRVETRLHAVGSDGLVAADPVGLARAAGVPLDAYALASAMQSEESSELGRLAVGRAVWNEVGGDRSKIFSKLAPHGRFGRQDKNGYADTRHPPTARTILLAREVIEGRVPDVVRGAVQWDAPAAQDRAHASYLRDPEHHPPRRSAAEVAARRIADGMTLVRVPGVPDTRFWARA
jgi:hypothetical protein